MQALRKASPDFRMTCSPPLLLEVDFGAQKRGGTERKEEREEIERRGVFLHVRSAVLTNVMIAKRIRTPLLPVMARPVDVPRALTLAADPSPIEILQPARPRAAGRRDEAVSPRAGILTSGLRRREDGGGRAGQVLVGGRVDGCGRAIRISGDEAGWVCAGVLVVVVDERVLAHAVSFFIFGLALAQDLSSERRGAETS